MNKQNGLTVVYLVAGAILPYLLQQTDVPIPPLVKVILTAANFALVALARFSNPSGEPQKVTIEQPVQVTAAPNPEEPQP